MKINVQANQCFKEVDRSKKRYIVMKGSAGSGKSVDTAQNYILRLMRDKGRNLVAMRKSDITNRDSTFAELTGSLYKMFGDKADAYWKINRSPLMLTCRHNGNQIIFRGMNDDRQREKLKSITFPNNLKDFDTPLYVVKGFQGDNLDELQQNLKTKKIVGTDSEGDVEVRTVDIPYQARKAKADEDEKNIYRFGMGFNSSQVGDGNITNIVIKSRYALLDLKANKLERRLKRLLKQLLKVVLDEINQMHGTGYKVTDVRFEFTRSIMMNESENIANEKTEADTQQVKINTILNMATQIGDEQTLKALCDVMDWDFDELKEQLKNADSSTAQDARTVLGAIVPDDPDNPDDEPVEE